MKTIPAGENSPIRNGFTQVPNFILHSEEIKPIEKLIYSILISFNPVFPSLRKIAKLSGLSYATVIRHTSNLENILIFGIPLMKIIKKRIDEKKNNVNNYIIPRWDGVDIKFLNSLEPANLSKFSGVILTVLNEATENYSIKISEFLNKDGIRELPPNKDGIREIPQWYQRATMGGIRVIQRVVSESNCNNTNSNNIKVNKTKDNKKDQKEPFLEISPNKNTIISEIKEEKQEQEIVPSFPSPISVTKVQLKEEEKKEEKEPIEQIIKEDTLGQNTEVLIIGEVPERNELNNIEEHKYTGTPEYIEYMKGLDKLRYGVVKDAVELPKIEVIKEEIIEEEIPTDEECERYNCNIGSIQIWTENLIEEKKLYSDDYAEFWKFIVNEISKNVNGEITWDMAYTNYKTKEDKYLQDYICIKGRWNEDERQLIRTNPDNNIPSMVDVNNYINKRNELTEEKIEVLSDGEKQHRMEVELLKQNIENYKNNCMEEWGEYDEEEYEDVEENTRVNTPSPMSQYVKINGGTI